MKGNRSCFWLGRGSKDAIFFLEYTFCSNFPRWLKEISGGCGQDGQLSVTTSFLPQAIENNKGKTENDWIEGKLANRKITLPNAQAFWTWLGFSVSAKMRPYTRNRPDWHKMTKVEWNDQSHMTNVKWQSNDRNWMKWQKTEFADSWTKWNEGILQKWKE